MPSSTNRHFLRVSIETTLIPMLENSGFERVPLAGEDLASRDIRSGFPFGRLRRYIPDGADLADIQIDKRYCAFRVNFGRVPETGVDHPISGHIDFLDVWAHYLPVSYELCANALFRRWFSAETWFGKPITQERIHRIVHFAALALPEMEMALAGRRLGPHVRRVRFYWLDRMR